MIKDRMISDEWRARFEQMGEREVRMLIATTYEFGDDTHLAYRWLEEKDQERDEAARAAQRRTDKTTEIAAIVAAAGTVLGIVIAILAWLFPRH
jgi:hypothetical protein